MAEAKWNTSGPEIQAIVDGKHADPFKVLGLHQFGKNWVARCFVPGSDIVHAQGLDGSELGELEKRHPSGFFEGLVNIEAARPLRYLCANGGGRWIVADADASRNSV